MQDLPARIDAARVYLRPYRPGDGAWYFPMSLRNAAHLARYEAGNPVLSIRSEADAERVVGEFAAAWAARTAFFLGVFLRHSDEFVAQIYVGVVSRELPELEVGYFAERDHEGAGYVTEAARAALGLCFVHLGAHRVRLECDDTNLRSYRVAERCGMRREGHLRENRRNADGSLSGTLLFGMLRGEYDAGA